MKIAALLQIGRGVTAIIGGGGKTTLMEVLAGELSQKGSVILMTTTHIRRPAQLETLTDADEALVSAALSRSRIVCVGEAAEEGKLRAPRLSIETLARLADFVLVEADGSRQLPLKAHAAHEPVVPPCSRQVICVVGMSGLHRPVREAVHRPELFCPLAGCNPEDEVTAELVARGLLREGLADTVFLNQAESDSVLQDAAVIASRLKLEGLRVVCGSQRQQQYKVL